MADRKATNKYYPPDWDPSKGSINKYVGQHPLRDRARKLSEGILIIRFELPFNIWCFGCERHLARGVRFNAEKKQVGSYHSTKIWSFRMKCPSCSGWIEIRTEPKDGEYVVVAGGRRKNEEFDPEDVGLARPKTKEEAEKIIYNPFFRLERTQQDLQKANDAAPRITQMLHLNSVLYRQDFDNSRSARHLHRLKRAEDAEKEKKIEDLRIRLDVHELPLLPEVIEDVEEAASVRFKRSDETEKRIASLRSSSIFPSKKRAKVRPSHALDHAGGSILEQLSLAKRKK